MNLNSLLLPALSLLALSSRAVVAQTLSVYDDFNGTSLDTKKWLQDGTPVTIAKSRAGFRLTAANKKEARSEIWAYEAFSGDFEFVLDFDNYANTVQTGAGLELYIEGADNPAASEKYVNLELVSYQGSQNKIIKKFGTWMSDGKTETEFKGPTVTATSGQMRIQRTSKGISVYYRMGTQSGFTLIKTWPNALPKLVHVGISTWAGDETINNSGKFGVDCDKIRAAGKRIPGPVNYGKRCHGALTVAAGLPHLGNANFGYFVGGNTQLAGSPTAMILGSNKLNLVLAPSAPSCYLNTNPILFMLGTILGKDGVGFVRLPVPNDNSLVGVNVKAQHLVIKLGINNLGIAFTQGVETKIFKL